MQNGLQSSHPLYVQMMPIWVQMRDTYKGERQVKSKSQLYLPPTTAHIQDGWPIAEELGAKA